MRIYATSSCLSYYSLSTLETARNKHHLTSNMRMLNLLLNCNINSSNKNINNYSLLFFLSFLSFTSSLLVHQQMFIWHAYFRRLLVHHVTMFAVSCDSTSHPRNPFLFLSRLYLPLPATVYCYPFTISPQH